MRRVYGVKSLGLRVKGKEFRVQSVGLELGFKVQG